MRGSHESTLNSVVCLCAVRLPLPACKDVVSQRSLELHLRHYKQALKPWQFKPGGGEGCNTLLGHAAAGHASNLEMVAVVRYSLVRLQRRSNASGKVLPNASSSEDDRAAQAVARHACAHAAQHGSIAEPEH